MLQQSVPGDYVLATGEAHSVREFIELSFAHVGIEIAWKGTGRDEQGFDAASGKLLVEVDPRYFRPTEVERLVGDPGKARRVLGWNHKTGFAALVAEMVDADLKSNGRELRHSDD